MYGRYKYIRIALRLATHSAQLINSGERAQTAPPTSVPYNYVSRKPRVRCLIRNPIRLPVTESACPGLLLQCTINGY